MSRKKFNALYANNLDAFIPEFWANESLAILEENMVIGNLVHRDFEDIVQKQGDIVNTRRPGEFVAKRKIVTDSVVVQDATATNVQIPLDQHIHTSFLINDGDESKSMKDLVTEYMFPAVLAQARVIDQILLGQVYRFLATSYGGLGGLTVNNSIDYLTGIRNKMNQNKAYVTGRNLILTPNSETALLNNAQFTDASRVGDDGTALREASLGRKFGFNLFMCQNASSVATGNTTKAGAINLTAGYPAGTTNIVVTGFTGTLLPGAWFTIVGDNRPHQVVSSSATLGNATGIIFTPPLGAAVLNNAVITTYTAGAVNLPAGYPAGYAKEIVVSGFAVAPQVGQMVSFGTGTDVYSIISVTGLTGITLDRPLGVAIANADVANIGPPGEYNFAFHRNALALVCRPLGAPKAGTGALSSVVNMNGLSMRACITYNGDKQGHLVTLDLLCGIAILDAKLGGVMLG